MKQLLALVAVLAVVGIGGFMYRNALEAPGRQAGTANCTLEAKVCADGTSVGRQGPDCAFTACPLPNYEVAELGIGFVIPAGYVQNRQSVVGGAGAAAAFEKPSQITQVPHVISIRSLPIPEGQTAEQVMVANTTFDTSEQPVASIAEFTPVTYGTRSFRMLTTDRFEGQVHTVYYLPRENDVIRFDLFERDIGEAWLDPALVIADLPEHQAMRRLLESLQTL